MSSKVGIIDGKPVEEVVVGKPLKPSKPKGLVSETDKAMIVEMRDLLEREGCSDPLLAKKIVEGLSASKSWVNKYGDTVEEIDWDTRLKYLTLALGIKNHRTKSVDDSNSDKVITLQIIRAESNNIIDITRS